MPPSLNWGLEKSSQTMAISMPKKASSTKISPSLSVGFVLMPSFTLLPFSAFVDALRLAADEGDQSQQINCHWTVMGPNLEPISSSSGVQVKPWETYRDPTEFDYIVVVGGLLQKTLQGSQHVIDYLQQTNRAHVPIIGLCTGSFAMIRAGLMHQRRCCVSWFHYKDLSDHYSDVIPVAEQLFVDDGDRITCAGGAVATARWHCPPRCRGLGLCAGLLGYGDGYHPAMRSDRSASIWRQGDRSRDDEGRD